MKITTSKTITSKLYPEVTYTVRSLSEGRRQQLTAQIADATYKMYDLIGQSKALLPELTAETILDPITEYKVKALNDKISELANRDMRPAWIRVYVTKIDGLEIDGVAATVDSFLSDAPSDMVLEAAELIRGQAELSVDEVKN
jgi:hypothetical protein